MSANDDQLTEKAKVNIAKKAFDKFMKKMDELFKRQNELFESIIKRINERKIDEQRKKIDEAYKKKVEEAFRKKNQGE